MTTTTKPVLSQNEVEVFTAAFKSAHHALLGFLVANKLDTSDIPSDFSKCTLDTYGKISRRARDLMSEKVEADKVARLLPFRAAMAKAAETYISQAQADWAQVAALPQEVRDRLGMKAPTTCKVPVSSFSTQWKQVTDMNRDLEEMKVKVIKGAKGDYIEVPFSISDSKEVDATTLRQKAA